MEAQCGSAWNSRRADWSWFIDAKGLASKVSIISRPSHRRSWFQEALQIDDSQIHSFPDTSRHSYQFFDSLKPTRMGSYDYRLGLAELRELNATLLEFGSMYQPYRLDLAERENLAVKREMKEMMALTQPVLERVSDLIVGQLGGRDSYVSAHLRLGVQGRDDFAVRSLLASDCLRVSFTDLFDLLEIGLRAYRNCVHQNPRARVSTSFLRRQFAPLVSFYATSFRHLPSHLQLPSVSLLPLSSIFSSFCLEYPALHRHR